MTQRAAYHGILIPAATLDTSTSTYTEQGPRTGIPTADAATSLILAGGGSQASGSSRDLRVQRAGHPQRGEAGIVHRDTTGPGPWYGANPPHVPTGFSGVVWGVLDSAQPQGLGACVSAAGVLMACFQRTPSVGSRVLGVSVFDDDAGAWGTPVTVASGASADYWPCLVPLPSGRVLLLVWAVAGTEASIRTYYSDDDGATWATAQEYASVTPLDTATYTPRRIAAAYSRAQILVLAEVEETGATNVAKQITQLASDDDGASFYEVLAPQDTADTGYAWPVVTPADGGGFIGAALSNNASNGAGLWRFGTAWQPLSSLDRLTPAADSASTWSGSPSDITAGILGMARSSAGALYLYYLLPGTSGVPAMSSVSLDDGVTWSRMGESSRAGNMGSVWWGASASGVVQPTEVYAVAHRSRNFLILSHTGGASGERDEAVDALQVGDHATVTLPSLGATPRESTRVGADYTWYPWGNPATITGDSAGSTSGTLSWASDYMQVSTTSGQDYDWSQSITGDEVEGVIFYADMKHTAGLALTGSNVGVLLRAADTGVGYELEIKTSTASLQIRDPIAPATLATITLDGTTYPDMAEGIRILAAISEDTYAVWVAPAAPTEGTGWVLADSGSGLSDDAGAGGTSCSYQWGHFITESIAQTNTSRWRMRWATSDRYTGGHLAQGFTSPDDLFPISLSSEPTYLADGATVRGVAGPGEYGTTYTLAAAYDYPITRLLYSDTRSPRQLWRSVDDTAAAILDFTFASVAGDAFADGVDAIRLEGCNWRTATLEVNSGGSYTSIKSLDLAEGRTALPYVRDGDTITVDLSGSPSSTFYLDREELVGHTVDLGSGVLRRVSENTDGQWGASGRYLRLTLEGVDDGADPASGTCSIWSTDALIVIRRVTALGDAKPRRRGYRLTIGIQSTVDGDFACKAMVGEVAILGKPPDQGSQRVTAAPVEVYEAADGSETTSRQLGPVRRTQTISWSDQAITEHHISGSAPNPPTYTATSTTRAPQVAAKGADARTMEAMVKRLAGLATPVTWCRYIPDGPADVTVELRRRLFITGRLQGPVQVDEVQGVRASARDGAEYGGKLVRVAQTSIVELV